jgi:hypothetical protein
VRRAALVRPSSCVRISRASRIPASIRSPLSSKGVRTGTIIFESLELFAREVLPEFDAREEDRAKRKQEELAPFIEQAIMRKEKMAPFAEDKIPSFLALGRQVAANGPQLTPEQEAARRRMLAAAQIPLENPEKASAAE